MAFDQPTRNRLARFVGDSRSLLTAEFTRQLQHDYGLDPVSGDVTDLARLNHLDDARRETARLLRETLAHYLAGQPRPTAKARREALERIVREQAFTLLNRLCALRMMEARDLLLESVGQGYRSKGFQLYSRLAGPALGETGDAYCSYLFSLFDEFAVDLPVLFDRFSPQGRLFPRPTTLLQLLDEINQPDIDPLWAEDETIGWIYQYFNSVEERRQMRSESQAPRNSRELAVRNQFFTPRYVVEFLTDNTLGRLWYEMTQGQTALVERCRYLVRRPVEIFLDAPDHYLSRSCRDGVRRARCADFSELPDDPTEDELVSLSLAFNGYDLFKRLRGDDDFFQWANDRTDRFNRTGDLPASSLDLWLILFAFQRAWRNLTASAPADEDFLGQWRQIYLAWKKTVQAEPADLSQEDLLRQPVYLPHRAIEDPRDLKMLDPACGSMHFGLYAFDLFEQIYLEAWALEAERGSYALHRPPGLQPLRETYPDETAFRRDIPRLIIEHNIHGIDIDPRAVQIAGLSLWLRAQKSWHSQGVKATDRPEIKRSNIVTAEPMPGDAALLAEFIQHHLSATPEEKLLGQLLERVFAGMTLAGEAGSLLKIEEEIAADIAQAKEKWHAQPKAKQTSFFEDGQPEQAELGLDVSGITDTAFWEQAETRIYNALQQYAEQVENGHSYRRRLFAEDAARGFAFIDLCRQNYDAVLMNPPFGAGSKRAKAHLEQRYPHSKNDIYATFVERWLARLNPSGKLGAITSRTGFFLSSFQKWREEVILQHAHPVAFADLGFGVLDAAMVETAAYSLSRQPTGESLFFRLMADVDKAEALHVQTVNLLSPTVLVPQPFVVDPASFQQIPGSPFAYWVSNHVRRLFQDLPSFQDKERAIRVGLQTGDDFRFVRTCWEVPLSKIVIGTSKTTPEEFCQQTSQGRRWVPFAKGGEYAQYYSDIHLVVNWEKNGKAIRNLMNLETGRLYSRPQNSDFYFKLGLTWSDRTTKLFSARAWPAGGIFSVKGSAGFFSGQEFLALGLMNSLIFNGFLSLLVGAGDTAARSYQVGTIGSVPFPSNINSTDLATLKELATTATRNKISFDTTNEISHAFSRPALCLATVDSLNQQTVAWIGKIAAMKTQLVTHQQRIDDLAFRLYGLEEKDRRAIEVSLGDVTEVNTDIVDDSTENELTPPIEASGLVAELVSYSMGIIFGRWDIRYTTGEKEPPELPDPFAPLPVCPPGMLQNSQGLPASPADIPPDYPLRISWPGILVDDPGHPEDIETRVREALRVIWPDTADAIEQEACQILGVPSLRAYFASPNNFFDDHLKRYSKSRRAAPIYWPLSTPSGSYTLWLYYHRLDDQMLYTCINDFVDPKLKEAGQQISALRQKANRTKAEENDLERLSDLETELHEFRAELLRLAAFWRPNLNDGVQITAAPLWRLFQHRQWQSRLKETWDKLEAGDYDWAHLAMSVWPERVVPKCIADRSLAIAHDLEDLFWVEDGDKWRLLQTTEQEIAGQIKQRQNPAYTRLGQYLADLAAGAGRGMPAYQVWQHLSEGNWDDTRVALALWPERVAEKCWDQPFLAAQLGLKLPGKRTQAQRNRFLKQLLAESVPELAAAVAVAFQDESDAFDTVWQALSAGRRDEQPLALALWPERVVDKCVGDVELARQHNLHPYFWVQSPGGGPWRRRNPQAQEVRDEVARRKDG